MHRGKNNPIKKYYIEEEDGNKLELETTDLTINDYDGWYILGTG